MNSELMSIIVHRTKCYTVISAVKADLLEPEFHLKSKNIVSAPKSARRKVSITFYLIWRQIQIYGYTNPNNLCKTQRRSKF